MKKGGAIMTCKDCMLYVMCYKDGDRVCEHFIDKADVQEVRHGKWIGRNRDHCSECGKRESRSTKYCPNCGARMDG